MPKTKTNQEVVLTRHFAQEKSFGPLHTGGMFILSKLGRVALALNDDKVTLLNVDSGETVGQVKEDNEDILSFALSPNQQLLATSNKNYMVRVYKIADGSLSGESKVEEGAIKCF